MLKSSQRLAKQEKENERLRRVIKLMAGSEGGSSGDEEMAAEALEYGEGGDEEGSVTASEQDETPAALWDGDDYVYRCVECWGEIDDGFCFLCAREHVCAVASWLTGFHIIELLFLGHTRRKSTLQ